MSNLKITNITGDLLATEVDIMCHQTNCLGVMGAGVALQVKNKYPSVFSTYYELCQKDRENNAGRCQLVKTNGNKYVANMFSQIGIGLSKISHIPNTMVQYGGEKKLCKKLNLAGIIIPIVCLVLSFIVFILIMFLASTAAANY